MRIILAALTIAMFVPAMASAEPENLPVDPNEPTYEGPGDVPDGPDDYLDDPSHPSHEWIMKKKLRRMKNRANVATPPDATKPVEQAPPVPEPSAGLLFGLGALVAGSRLRRARKLRA